MLSATTKAAVATQRTCRPTRSRKLQLRTTKATTNRARSTASLLRVLSKCIALGISP